MSKDEAWKEIENAWIVRCHEVCGWECDCEQELQQIKEVLYV